jgi:hypothetical protein
MKLRLLTKRAQVCIFSAILLISIINAAPTISSFTPTTAIPGSVVSITGSNFNTTASNNVVFFGATKAKVTAATENSITVEVPIGATYQFISVTDITTGLTTYSKFPFTPKFNSSASIDNGSFVKSVATDLTSGTKPQFIATGDLDGDGKSDLVVANYNSASVSVYRNSSIDGITTFEDAVNVSVGNYPLGIAISDLNGDGKLDIAVCNSATTANSISIIQNSSSPGTLSLSVIQTLSKILQPMAVAIGDIDNDGNLDLVAGSNVKNGRFFYFRNITATPGASITFGSADSISSYTSSAYSKGITMGDLDNDGLNEIVIASGSNSAGVNSIQIVKNSSTPGIISLTTDAKFKITNASANVAFTTLADIDGDGLLDILVPFNDTIFAFQNTNSIAGTISFNTTSAKLSMPAASVAWRIAVGDLNGDGKPDLAVPDAFGTSPYHNNTVSVFVNSSISGAISFGNRFDYSGTGNQPYGIVIADFDSDGRNDWATSNNAGNSVSVFGNQIPLAPTILSFSPVSASIEDTVKITGADFTGATSVSFGGIAATSFTVVSSKEVVAIVGNGSSGDVSITSTNGTTSLSGFTFVATPAPSITSFLPTTAGVGDTVVITGSNFKGVTSVSFGGIAASAFVKVSSSIIKAVVGNGATGEIGIVTYSGTDALSGFTYESTIPTISSFLPTSATLGDSVVIIGTNFKNVTGVNFGNVAADSFKIVSSSKILAFVGSGASGIVSVIKGADKAEVSGFTYNLASQAINFETIPETAYGTADFTPGAVASSGLPITYSSSDNSIATIVSDKIHIEKPGTCIIYANQSGNAVYSPAIQSSQNLTITPKSLTLSNITISNKLYDGKVDATITNNGVLSGVVNSDDVILVTGTATFANKDAGDSKAINIEGFGLTGGKASNYILSIPTITASIIKDTLTVTADNKTKIIFEANPTFTYSITGFVNNEDETVLLDSPIASCSADDYSLVGTYPIVLSGGNASNYAFVYVSGILTITYNTATSIISEGECLIYPNPVTDYITVLAPNEAKITIVVFDMYGKILFNKILDNNTLDVSSLPSGLYTIKVNSHMFKIIKH